ncbi:HAD domain-containing protein [Roseateles sp. DAIF2]|uniref:HAD domain-containing protein n=1 Tax=Roseateles sp. DAIF2 TaxID=2714952 RepID=UPI0021111D16|nr:HAD domain-containing protein [Roseateles sp. DAIF2]
MRATLFLNLDGTCHPRDMQYLLLRGYPHAGALHFCWSESLRPILEEWDATVVLRSTAASMYGVDAIKSLAPEWLRSRIEGATGEVVRYIALFELRKVNTAFGTIRTYVQQHQLKHWVALSDDDEGWPDSPDIRKHLVQVDGSTGLSDPIAAKRLSLALAECKP